MAPDVWWMSFKTFIYWFENTANSTGLWSEYLVESPKAGSCGLVSNNHTCWWRPSTTRFCCHSHPAKKRGSESTREMKGISVLGHFVSALADLLDTAMLTFITSRSHARCSLSLLFVNAAASSWTTLAQSWLRTIDRSRHPSLRS